MAFVAFNSMLVLVTALGVPWFFGNMSFDQTIECAHSHHIVLPHGTVVFPDGKKVEEKLIFENLLGDKPQVIFRSRENHRREDVSVYRHKKDPGISVWFKGDEGTILFSIWPNGTLMMSRHYGKQAIPKSLHSSGNCRRLLSD